MAFSVCLRNAFISFWIAWSIAFAVTRLYYLQEEYIAEVGKRRDETWLLRQCNDPEFYANLRQHSDICTEVENNARASLLLRALSKVMERSMHICGNVSCTEAIYTLGFRMGWHAVIIGIVLLIAAPNILLMVLRSIWNSKVSTVFAVHSTRLGWWSSSGWGQ